MADIGIQLYSVRKEIETKGLAAVLKDVASAGFNCVEFAGFYGHSPKEVVKMLKDNKLNGISAHIGYTELDDWLPYIDEIGMRYVYVPSLKHQLVDGKVPDEVCKKLETFGDKLLHHGVRFGYHNHSFEYANGGDVVADLLARVPVLTSELDIFWATAAGKKPTDLMKKYGKKLSALHIKEMDKRTGDNPDEYPQPVPGEGKAGCREAFELAKEMGVRLYVLECEYFPEGSVEDYLKKAAAAMTAMAGD